MIISMRYFTLSYQILSLKLTAILLCIIKQREIFKFTFTARK